MIEKKKIFPGTIVFPNIADESTQTLQDLGVKKKAYSKFIKLLTGGLLKGSFIFFYHFYNF